MSTVLLPLVASRGHCSHPSSWNTSLHLPSSFLSSASEQVSQVVRVKEVRHAITLVQPPQVVVVVEGGREADEGDRGVGGEDRAGELVLCHLKQAGGQAQDPLHVQQRGAHATAAGNRAWSLRLREVWD